MEDCVDQVGHAKYVSQFDLLKGYWQVPLTQWAQEISAIVTASLYSYNVMPYGLWNAPATFQRLLMKVMGDFEGCIVYLDNVVVYSDTWSSHLQHIRALFCRLADACLTEISGSASLQEQLWHIWVGWLVMEKSVLCRPKYNPSKNILSL